MYKHSEEILKCGTGGPGVHLRPSDSLPWCYFWILPGLFFGTGHGGFGCSLNSVSLPTGLQSSPSILSAPWAPFCPSSPELSENYPVGCLQEHTHHGKSVLFSSPDTCSLLLLLNSHGICWSEATGYVLFCFVGKGSHANCLTTVGTGSFAGGSVVRNLPQYRGCRTCGSIAGLGRSPWRKAWQPTPVFLPGKSCGQRSLVGFSLWGRKESDVTEATEHTHM